MKSPTTVFRSGLLALALLLTGAKAGWSQPSCDTDVTVRLFPLDNAELQRVIERNASFVLTAINRQSYQSTENITAEAAQKVVEEIMGTYCTRQRSYNGLLVPHLSEALYEVRGLHLVSNEDGTTHKPQAVLQFDENGLIVGVDIVDDEQRERNRALRREEAARLPRGEEVIDLVLALEASYNRDGTDQIAAGLRENLPNASVIVSRLFPTGQASTKSLTSEQYIQNLRHAIDGLGRGEPEITYEFIRVYPHIDEAGEMDPNLYRVTLLQHWMYPPPGYLDSDYIALDIQLLDTLSIATRRAGRGSFFAQSVPPGVSIVSVDDQETALTTPHHFENVPLQYHYLTVDDVWYESEIATSTPDNVLERDTLRLVLDHLPGQLRIIVDPTDSRLDVNDTQRTDFQSGSTVTIQAEELLRALGEGAGQNAYPGTTRPVRLRLSRPYYESWEETVNLPSPDIYPVEVTLRRLRGDLIVTSTPESSEVFIDTEPAGVTALTTELEVTGDDRDPYQVKVRNDACLPGEDENDCLLHIPSLPEPAVIESDAPTRIDVELTPFYIRNDTKNGVIDVDLEREDGTLYVDYDLSDSAGRNRKYKLELSIQDAQGNESPVDAAYLSCRDESRACIGKRMRPGANGFAWNMDFPEGSMPVLTLSRKRICWPCVLIPAAAGVAAAYIWPRTGSGGGGFAPPPRPSETQNR